MIHPEFAAQVDALLDDELADADLHALEEHLAQCAECARFRDERVALRAAIKAQLPALRAPEALRARIQSELRAEAPRGTPGRLGDRSSWRSVLSAASLVIFALGGWAIGRQQGAANAMSEQLLASHVRSLMPGHLTDVLSSDQHTVKPWFNGKLDYSPPVYDMADRGFPLVGGRLDYVGGQPVAVMVYARRQHMINVFVWPSSRGIAPPAAVRDWQGYHLVRWTSDDYSFSAVSDLALPELTDLSVLLQEADSAAH